MSCECKSKFYGRKCKLNQEWNNDKCRCECNNQRKHVYKNDYIGILVHALIKMVNIEKMLLMIP